MFFKYVRLSDRDRIRRFRFSYGTGIACNASVVYILTEKNEKYQVSIKPDGIPEAQAYVRTVDEEFPQQLLQMLKAFRIGRWNGYHKVDKMVLDGTGFSLEVHFFSGKTIRAHGYMRTPQNYGEVRAELNRMFMRLYSDAT